MHTIFALRKLLSVGVWQCLGNPHNNCQQFPNAAHRVHVALVSNSRLHDIRYPLILANCVQADFTPTGLVSNALTPGPGDATQPTEPSETIPSKSSGDATPPTAAPSGLEAHQDASNHVKAPSGVSKVSVASPDSLVYLRMECVGKTEARILMGVVWALTAAIILLSIGILVSGCLVLLYFDLQGYGGVYVPLKLLQSSRPTAHQSSTALLAPLLLIRRQVTQASIIPPIILAIRRFT